MSESIDLSTLSREDLANLLLKREAELAAVKAAKSNAIAFKVSDKGALSMYGLGRFPVTLYAGQWERVLANVDGIRNALNVNAEKLSRKDDK